MEIRVVVRVFRCGTGVLSAFYGREGVWDGGIARGWELGAEGKTYFSWNET